MGRDQHVVGSDGRLFGLQLSAESSASAGSLKVEVEARDLLDQGVDTCLTLPVYDHSREFRGVPLEWLARMADHIPDPGKHRTLVYSYYANRVREDRAVEKPGEGKVEEEPANKRRCTASCREAAGDRDRQAVRRRALEQ